MFGRSTYQGQGIYQQRVKPIAGQLWGSALKDAGDSIADMITANKERARKDKEANQVATAMEKVLDYTAGDSSWKPDDWEEMGPQARVQMTLGLQSQITAEQERKRAEEQQLALEQRTAQLLGSLDPDLANVGPVDPSLASVLLSNERGKDQLAATIASDQANAQYRQQMLGLQRARLNAENQARNAPQPVTPGEILQHLQDSRELGKLQDQIASSAFWQNMDMNGFMAYMAPAEPMLLSRLDLERIKRADDPYGEVTKLIEERGPENFGIAPVIELPKRGLARKSLESFADWIREPPAYGTPDYSVYNPMGGPSTAYTGAPLNRVE